MNCEHYRNTFGELLDGTLSAAMENELQRHLQSCVNCRQQLAEERIFRHQLTQLPTPPMRAGFPAEVMGKLRQQQAAHVRHRSFATGFGSAIAAGMALWFAVNLTTTPRETGQKLQAVALTLGRVEQVNLVFDSPEEFGQTTFALLLPDNAELDGYPGRHEFTWTASLRKGKNRLVLPIRVSTPGDGEIVARISQSDDIKVFRLRLNVQSRSGARLNSRRFV